MQNSGIYSGRVPSVGCTSWSPEVQTLWAEWKDHLLYVVSAAYQAGSGLGPCGSSDCVTVGGSNKEAAIIIYSGSPDSSQVRVQPPVDAVDTKKDAQNYLEAPNLVPFLSNTGNAAFTKISTASPSADIMYCISDGPTLNVGLCP